jgi:dihydrofolate reductase
MRKLIVTEFITLDGVVEAPGGEPSHPHTGWVGDRFSERFGAYKEREVQEADCHLLGRVTYESFAGAWPTYEGTMADKMNSMEKVVVSSTLRDPEWTNTRVIGFDDVAALRAGDGGPILVAGSATLVQGLLEADLVDELRLQLFPVLIGGGLRCFPEHRGKSTFALTGTESFDHGVVAHTYERVAG